MIIRQFLASTQASSAGQRAESAAALARAFLYGGLGPEEAWEAKTALFALLDDPAPVVRGALAEACAASARAPRALVVALASDQPEIAGLVLARSPVLTDADLVDAAAMGGEAVRAMIAGRHHLSHAVAGALAEIGGVGTLCVLAANPTANITTGRLLRMVERHGGDAALREALLARADLPIEVRHAVGARLARTLADFAAACGWLSPERGARMSREAGERTVLDLCDGAGAAAQARVVRHLRGLGELNAGLILRAILSGQMPFVEAAYAELTGLDGARIAGLLREPRGIATLHQRGGLAAALLPAFTAALTAWREAREGTTGLSGAGLSRRMIERSLSACEDMPFGDMQAVTALLARYEAEAARDEAREVARAIAEEAAARETARRATEALEAEWRDAQGREAERLMAERMLADPVAEPDEASSPFDAVLDALPEAILASFREEQERLEREAEEARAREAAEAALAGFPEALLAQFRIAAEDAPDRLAA
ncbi:DUF2336 domain-containing protein [Methylobacterium sp. A54F]